MGTISRPSPRTIDIFDIILMDTDTLCSRRGSDHRSRASPSVLAVDHWLHRPAPPFSSHADVRVNVSV